MRSYQLKRFFGVICNRWNGYARFNCFIEKFIISDIPCSQAGIISTRNQQPWKFIVPNKTSNSGLMTFKFFESFLIFVNSKITYILSIPNTNISISWGSCNNIIKVGMPLQLENFMLRFSIIKTLCDVIIIFDI